MKLYTKLTDGLIVFSILLCASTIAVAAPNNKALLSEAKNIQRAIDKFAVRFKKLPAAQQKTLVQLLQSKVILLDSDLDLLPDILESEKSGLSTNLCDSDSDDDGVLDGDELP